MITGRPDAGLVLKTGRREFLAFGPIGEDGVRLCLGTFGAQSEAMEAAWAAVQEYRRKAHDLISEERLNLAVEQSAPPAEPAPVSWAAESIRRLEEQKAAREAAEKPREHPEDRKVRRADLRRARARVLRRRRSMIGTSILLLLAIATFLVWWFGWWSR